jgi:sugar phosphate permease
MGPGTSVSDFAFVLFIAGFVFGAPEAIIGSAIASDLGASYVESEDLKAVSTIAGIINGIGSLGAALIQIIVPFVKDDSFWLYTGLSLLAAVLLTPNAIKEFKSKNKNKNLSIELGSH